MTLATAPAEVEDRLARYAAATREAMADLLAQDPPAPYLSELVAEYPARAGKGLRPALLLASCQAHGGTLADGLAPAVALELLHNAFLIHDDVEDESPSRRGDATLHEAHGVGLAVNAGDALAAAALEPLLAGGALGSRLARDVLQEFLTMVRHTTAGQALELGWRRENVLDVATRDYLGLAVRKTSWYTTVAPLRVGAIIGSRGTAPLAPLSRFGLYLGVAFQIRDDLLSLLGARERHGKEPLGDLREGKRTLMLIHLLAHAGPRDRAWLGAYLADPEAGCEAGGADRVVELMEAHGSLAFAAEYADAMVAAAGGAFDDAFASAADGPALGFLRGLIPYVLGRSA
jgi:geranylgeranyl diphosphate synthase, type II